MYTAKEHKDRNFIDYTRDGVVYTSMIFAAAAAPAVVDNYGSSIGLSAEFSAYAAVIIAPISAIASACGIIKYTISK